MITIRQIYQAIDSIAPFATQEPWDNAGFLIGDDQKEVRRCVVTLDVTKEVLSFAKEQQAGLIVSHHPVIFSKLAQIHKESIVYALIQSDIAVLSAHTNYDLAQGGINDVLAGVLQLQGLVSCADGCLRVGSLSEAMTADNFAAYVQRQLNAPQVRYTSVPGVIRKVAVCGGAGADFIRLAQENADAYVTGDASYHNLLDAEQSGFCLVAAGHYDTELPGVKALRSKLAALFPEVDFLDAMQKHPVAFIK